MGLISVHFRGSITYTGLLGGLHSDIRLHFGALNNFPHFFEQIILLNILDSISILLMNILHFVLNLIIFKPDQ